MKLILVSEDAIRLEASGAGLTIEDESGTHNYSPFHMMAGGLAACAFSVLYSWSATAGFSADDLSVDVLWEFAPDPHRVGSYHMHFVWPSLPEERVEAAKRVVEMCAVHATFHHPPTISVEVTTASDHETEHAQADGVETTG